MSGTRSPSLDARVSAVTARIRERSRDSRAAYLEAIGRHTWDIVVADNGVPSLNSADALRYLREGHPETAFVVVSGAGEEAQVAEAFQTGAADYIRKDYLWQLVVTIYRIQAGRQRFDSR